VGVSTFCKHYLGRKRFVTYSFKRLTKTTTFAANYSKAATLLTSQDTTAVMSIEAVRETEFDAGSEGQLAPWHSVVSKSFTVDLFLP